MTCSTKASIRRCSIGSTRCPRRRFFRRVFTFWPRKRLTPWDVPTMWSWNGRCLYLRCKDYSPRAMGHLPTPILFVIRRTSTTCWLLWVLSQPGSRSLSKMAAFAMFC